MTSRAFSMEGFLRYIYSIRRKASWTAAWLNAMTHSFNIGLFSDGVFWGIAHFCARPPNPFSKASMCTSEHQIVCDTNELLPSLMAEVA